MKRNLIFQKLQKKKLFFSFNLFLRKLKFRGKDIWKCLPKKRKEENTKHTKKSIEDDGNRIDQNEVIRRKI